MWIGTGEVLPENSPIWSPGSPAHGYQDCVGLVTASAVLFSSPCDPQLNFVCEALSVMTVTTTQPCPITGFNRIDGGCFYVENNNYRNWADAEAACQEFGTNVHLATLDTQQVGTFMLYHRRTTD